MSSLSIEPAMAKHTADPVTPPSFAQRRPSDPASRQQKRSANDLRPKPASSDVISTLLASFSSMSLPSRNDSVPISHKSAPQSPARSLYGGSVTASDSYYARSRPRVRPSEPTLVPHDLNVASANEASPPLDSDAAEPPVIRTARPPSGFSRLTSVRSSRRPQTSSETPPPIPLLHARSVPGTSEDQLGPLPNLHQENDRQRFTLSARASSESHRNIKQRDSLLVAHSREVKGKDRESARPSARTSAANTPGRQLSGFSSPRHNQLSGFSSPIPGSGRVSIQHSRATSPSPASPTSPSLQNARYPAALPATSLRRRKENIQNIPHSSPLSESTEKFDDLLLGNGRVSVPDRTSSLRLTESSPPSIRLRSSHSARHSNDFSVEEWRAKENTISPDSRAPNRRLYIGEMDEENDVMLRIKQLKDAKLKREQEKPKLPEAPDSRRVLAGPAPISEYSSATPQYTQDSLTAGASVGMSAASTQSNGFLKAHHTAMTTDSTPISSSRYRPSFESSPLRQSPSSSRPGSRMRRDSDLTSKPSSIHRRENSRGQTSMSFYPALMEEGRNSVDSVNDSVKAFLRSPRLSQKIVQREDNRTISFSEVGDPNGYVVFCCVGMGLTRYIMAFYEELAASLKLRLITPDRPGIGESDAYVNGLKKPLHWPGAKKIKSYLPYMLTSNR